MPEIVILGTGGALTSPGRHTTMLALVDADRTLLLDCGGDVVQRCLEAGIDPESIQAMFLSHKHPDHIGGFPLFLVKTWLHGRVEPMPVYGIPSALEQSQRILDAFSPESWHNFPGVEWHLTSEAPKTVIYEDDSWTIATSPGKHGVPVVGYLFTSKQKGSTVCYSCDTEPCENITELAKGCDILIHEANGNKPTHSSPIQAAQVAQDADVKELILIHLSRTLTEQQVVAAQGIFPNTKVAEELQTISF